MSNTRLEMENKQLRLQLANALDQAAKYRELNKTGSDAYNDLAKKVKDFCSQITSTEFAKRQVMQGGGGKMSLDEMLDFAIAEYEKERKEFQVFSLELSKQIEQRDTLIEDLQRQISLYEIQLSQPSYISNMPNENDEEDTTPPLPNPNDFDDEFVPMNQTQQNEFNMPLPSIDDEFSGLPSAMPPGIGLPPAPPVMPMVTTPMSNNGTNNKAENKKQGDKKPVVMSLDEEDFMEVVPRQKAEILPQNQGNKKINKNENPDGGEYVKANANSIPKDNTSGVRESQKQAIKMKLAAEKKEKEQMMMLADIGPLIIETKNNQIWYDILSLIGEKGISQRPEIEELLSEKGSGRTSLSNHITAMQKAGLITRENINTGYRRFIVLDLAPIGMRVFEEIFGKSPVESEVRRLTRENATKEHGYLIEDARTILLKEFGYAHVSIDRKKNTIALNNGKKYIPDLVASMDGKVWDYIEVERGTHTKEDFNEKLDKMLMTTRTFHFLAQNKEVLDVIIEKTEKWLLTKDHRMINGLTIKYSTLSHLAKRNWLSIKKY